MIGAASLAAAAWVCFLSHSRWLFSGGEPAPRRIESLDIQFADWPRPQPEQEATEHAEKTTARPAQQAAARPVVAPSRPLDFARAPKRNREEVPLAISRPQETQRQPGPVPPLRASPATSDRAVAPAITSAVAPASVPQSTAAQSTPPASGSAHIVSQPLPVLPEDLREEAYRFVATARFDVHADGTFDIVLVKPTPNPRLNQILMATLREWRFVPATEAGHPVESHQEVRVHFNVD